MLDKAVLNPLVSAILTDVPLFLDALFVGCLFCHGELAHWKPPASHLTAFYLMVALGGSIGSLAVGLVAPHASTWQVEIPEVILICGLLAVTALSAPGWGRSAAQGGLGVALALFAAGLLYG